MTINPAHARIPKFDVHDRLRKAREHAHIDQADLAKDLGVARQTVSNYERGAVKPRRAVVMAWAMRTGVPIKWLETGEAPPLDNEGMRLPGEYAPRDSNPEPSDLGRMLDLTSRIERAAA